jgi:tetratricopeptide (TPR) repeat protein
MTAKTMLAILTLLIAVAAAAFAERPQMTPEQATSRLREGFDLRGQRKHKEAIAVLEQVVAFDPRLEAVFPEQNTHLLAAYELAMAYFRDRNWEKALPRFVQADAILRELKPNADLLTPGLIAECRRQLARLGKPEEQSMVVLQGRLLAGETAVADGVLLTPVGEVASLLHLRLEREPGSRQVTLVGIGENAKTLVVVEGSRRAAAGDTPLSLPAAPVVRGEDVLIPLRAVAEYFGAKVRWDPLTRIVSVD